MSEERRTRTRSLNELRAALEQTRDADVLRRFDELVAEGRTVAAIRLARASGIAPED